MNYLPDQVFPAQAHLAHSNNFLNIRCKDFLKMFLKLF